MGIFNIFGSKTTSLYTSEVLAGTVDSHSHILYGVDDGVKTLEETLAVLEYDEILGITDVWCTPHVMEDSATDTDILKARFAELLQAYTGPVKLHLAAEYMLDTVFEQRFRDRDLLTIGEEKLLVETSTIAPPVNMYDTFREILSAGYRPLLAHPERYRYLNEASYERLIRQGVFFQLNLPSLVGFYGQTAKDKAEWMLSKGFYTQVGSDCHRLSMINEIYERKILSPEVISQLSRLVEG